ncbi:hypothetical protein A2U01_0000220 [Trifolium medium]|uniref:Uncharacterized protein n=1 Tax=Trifolium medium TaxID=97028 RepID=A0A392LWY4_9FABA|nr:hypothetical protein [Trifolium medium]
MWCKEDDSQRFRLTITGGDLTGEASFKLTNEVVRQLAPETCKALSSMPEGGSLYPQELDSFFGDPLLFKYVVMKVLLLEKNNICIGSPLKDYDEIDDFDQLDFAIVRDENELLLLTAKEDVSGSKRKLPEAFGLDDESSKVQKFKM